MNLGYGQKEVWLMVRCSGWSTTLLNSIGQIYIFGIFDGLGFRGRVSHQLRLLGFPPGYPPTTRERYEPSTAIKQYSTGRSSVLGLSDDGKVWSWTDDVAVLVKSVHVDLVENKVIEVQTGPLSKPVGYQIRKYC